MTERVVITGMSLLTTLGDEVDAVLDALLAGHSGLRPWRRYSSDQVGGALGSDLEGYDDAARMAALKAAAPPELSKKLARLLRPQPFVSRSAALMALDAWLKAGLAGSALQSDRLGAVVSGHFLATHYIHENTRQYFQEKEHIDGLCGLHGLDSNIGATVAELLGLKGPVQTVGAACASGSYALRAARNEIRTGEADVMLVVAPVVQNSPLDIFSLTLMSALAKEGRFPPERASRPFDIDRSGFLPAEAGAVLVVESLSHAQARGAPMLAEIAGLAVASDASHMPSPDCAGQARAMTRALAEAGVTPDQVDFVSAHATSTPQGDLSEVEAIRLALGEHAAKVPVNAPKSLLGHAMWAAATVETVLAVAQMNRGEIHASANIDTLDPAVTLDVCAEGPRQADIKVVLKNSFGFGGYNSALVLKRWAE